MADLFRETKLNQTLFTLGRKLIRIETHDGESIFPPVTVAYRNNLSCWTGGATARYPVIFSFRIPSKNLKIKIKINKYHYFTNAQSDTHTHIT